MVSTQLQVQRGHLLPGLPALCSWLREASGTLEQKMDPRVMPPDPESHFWHPLPRQNGGEGGLLLSNTVHLGPSFPLRFLAFLNVSYSTLLRTVGWHLYSLYGDKYIL